MSAIDKLPSNWFENMKALESERDRLKAELEDLNRFQRNERDQLAKERDLWKAKAEKLAEALNIIMDRAYAWDSQTNESAHVGLGRIWELGREALVAFKKEASRE